MKSVELDSITVRKAGTEILHDVTVGIEAGQVLAVLGASGSGKTTVLRAVAGLDPVEAGSIRFDGRDVGSLKTAERNVSFVFQNPVLFPRRTAGRNIAFPLELKQQPIDEIRRRVGAEARALHIESLLERRPSTLSAGETQVVQVARALVRQPDVLLLDEPFARVDAHQSDHLRRELTIIQRGFGVTAILAANEPIDVMTMADRVAVLEDGRVTQVDAPLDVYDRPATVNAALLTGDADVMEVTVAGDAEGSWLERPGLRVRAWQPSLRRHGGRRLQMVVRPEWWHLDPNGQVVAEIVRSQHLGATASLWCRVGGEPMTIKLSGRVPRRFAAGDVLRLRLERSVLIDPLDGFRLDLS